MRTTSLYLAIAIVLLSASDADAMTLEQYRTVKSTATEDTGERAKLQLYLLGLRDGLKAADLLLRIRGQARLHCLPDGLGLDVEEIEARIGEHLAVQEDASDFPDDWTVNLVLAGALEAAYPCTSP